MRRALAALLLLASPAMAGEVRGRVLLGETPAAGVTVAALPVETAYEQARREARWEAPRAPLARVATAADGGFVLALPATGNVQLRFEGGGAVPGQWRRVFEPGDAEDLGEVVLERGQRLAGKVVDGAGKPVAGAEVQLQTGLGTLQVLTGGFGVLQAVPQRTLSGADGTFSFTAAAARDNDLVVLSPPFAAASVARAAAGALRDPIRLAPGTTLAGEVRRGEARAGGALVRFEGRAATRWTEAGPDGRFTLAGLPAGEGTLVADAGTAGAATQRLTLPAALPVIVALSTPASLSGRVVDRRTGARVAEARLKVAGEDAAAAVRTDAQGRYRLAGLRPGSYGVSVDDPRLVPQTAAVVVGPGQQQVLDLAVSPAATLAGRVVDEAGAPVAGATAMAVGAEGIGSGLSMGQLRGVRTAADGSFRLTQLPAGGGTRLLVTHPEHEPQMVGGLSLGAGTTRSGLVVVMRRGVSVSGVVRDTAGHPLAGVELRLDPTGRRVGSHVLAAGLAGRDERRRATSDAEGRFTLRGLAAGEYALAARKAGFADELLEPVTVEAAAPEPLEVVLASGAAIRGVVKNADGSGAPGWTVTARASGRTSLPVREDRPEPSGRDGAFVIDGLRAGTSYDLTASGPLGSGPRRAGVLAPAEGVELQLAPTGRVSGRVLDEDARPVDAFGAACLSARGGGMLRRVGGRRQPADDFLQRAEDGSFVLSGVPAGPCDLRVEAEGYEPARVAGLAVEAGGETDAGEVRLRRNRKLRGRVVDAATRRGVPGARVSAQAPDTRWPGGSREAQTDADGRFELDAAAATLHLGVRHPEYAETTRSVEAAGTEALEIALSPGGAIAGVVVGPGGEPLPGAEVQLLALRRETAAQVSDALGQFRFEHCAPGAYGVAASLASGARAQAEVLLAPGGSAEGLRLTLAGGARVRGRVTGLPAERLGGLMVFASARDYALMSRTAADGTFSFSGVPPGVLGLRALLGDYGGASRAASAELTVPAGQAEAEVEVRFPAGFSLTGTVTRGGVPVPDAVVRAARRGGAADTSAVTDAAGGYRLEGLVEGAYVVSASARRAGGRHEVARPLAVSGDATLDLEIPTGRLAGVVVEAGSGTPLSEASVRLGDSGRGATTDSNGRFVIDDLEPGAYRLLVRRASYELAERAVSEAELASDITIELRRGEGIAVAARDASFAVPLGSLSVKVKDAQGRTVFMSGVALDSEGRGEIPSLPAGRYLLRAVSSGFAPLGPLAVSVPAGPLSLAFARGGELEVRVGPETRAKPEPRLRVLDARGEPYLWSLFTDDGVLALEGSSHRLPALAPGRYLLAVEGGGEHAVTIEEGATTVVTLP